VLTWRTLGRDYLYRNPWCAFRVDDVELPDGARIEYGVLESGGFAAVVPVTGGGEVVLVRQWRQPLGAFTLELPTGGVDAGEEPAQAATGLKDWSIWSPSIRARVGARRSATFSGVWR
jgi:ADP-ribose pyrophosphatase